MNKIFTLLSMVLSTILFAQNLPQSMKYQTVVSDLNGNIVKDQNVSFRFNIINRNTSVTIYQENITLTTNFNGLVYHEIGSGNNTIGVFNNIDWTLPLDYMVEFDPSGNTNYVETDVKSFASVPYAFLSETAYTALDDNDKNPNNEIQTISLSNDTLSLSDGGFVVLSNINVSVNWTDIAGIPADVLDGDNVNDADANPTNELQIISISNDTLYIENGNFVSLASLRDNTDDQSITISNDTIFLEDGGFVKLPAGTSFSGDWNDLTNIPADIADGDDVGITTETDPVFTASPANGITSADITNWNTDNVDDADANPTNELQILSISNDTLYIENGNFVNLASLRDNTDDQSITISNDTIFLEDGGFVKLPAGTSFSGNWNDLTNIPADIADGDDVGITTETDPVFTASPANGITAADITNWNTDNVDDADANPTNELQILSISNDTLYIENGNFVNLASLRDNTDDQSITISNDTIFLEDGGFVKLPATPSNNITDADNDTKIEVEQNADEDIIRFSTEGTEHFRMDNGRLEVLNTGSSVFIGEDAGLNDDFSNNQNTAVGNEALRNNTTGNSNTAIGNYALRNNTIGTQNTANGLHSLHNNTTGNYNTANGTYSLRDNTTGYENTATGNGALLENTVGNYNDAYGRWALKKNTSGSLNTAVGSSSLENNSTGNRNTATGGGASNRNTTGSYNIANGVFALYSNKTGSNNVAIGYRTGYKDTVSNNNVYVGHQAGFGPGAGNNYLIRTGNIFLGYQAGYNETGSNKLYIENSNSATPLIYGDFANDSLKIYGSLSVADEYVFPTTDGSANQVLQTDGNGQVSWVNVSGSSSTDDQTITISNDTLYIENGNFVSLASLRDNTDDQQLTISNDTIYLEDGGFVKLPATPSNNITDADNDTKIEVEQNADEDIIRFSTEGTEHFRMDYGRLEVVNTGNSVFIGEGAGANDDFSNNLNTAVGNEALRYNTSGFSNTANGYRSLYSNTTGNNNTANGKNSLRSNTTGSNNTANGSGAMRSNTTGSNNTSNGTLALNNNITGYSNTAVGSYAMNSNTTGFSNTAIGTNAISSNTAGIRNTTVGNHTLGNNKTGSNNLALGYSAGYKDSTSTNNVYLGTQAGYGPGSISVRYIRTGNVFLGYQSGYNEAGSNKLYIENSNSATPLIYGDFANDSLKIYGSLSVADEYVFPATDGSANQVLQTDGNGQVSWVYASGGSSTTLTDADNDTKIEVEQNADEDIIRFSTAGTEFFRMDSGRLEVLNTGGSVFIGEGAGANDDLITNQNTAVGHSALHNNTSGNDNAANGYRALYSNTTGGNNTANGKEALFSNTIGGANTANGFRALYSNTTGNLNTANGFRALYSNTTGFENTANGVDVLFNNTIGNYNTANGHNSLHYNTTGVANTANGNRSLYNNTTGSYNTAIGHFSGPSSTNPGLSNTSAVGHLAIPTASNQVRIGNSSVSSIGGYAAWSNLSDARFKTQVQQNVPGLDFVMQLKPVTYHLNTPKLNQFLGIADSLIDKQAEQAKMQIVQSGFLAQDVEKAAKALGYDFSGVDAPKNENDHYGLRYAEFVVPLTKAIQEQQAQMEAQQTQIDELKRQNELLLKLIEKLEK